MNLGLISVDDFYDDPDNIRDIALSSEYYEDKKSIGYNFGSAPWPGKMSKKPYAPNWIDVKVSNLLNKNVRQARQADSGCFRISKKNSVSANLLHADSANNSYYAGVLYLTKNKEDVPGTIFYKQKSTGLDRASNEEHLKSIILKNEFNDLDKWTTHTISNIVYNRLLIYPANKFHGIGPVFGDDDESARIVQIFYFIDIA